MQRDIGTRQSCVDTRSFARPSVTGAWMRLAAAGVCSTARWRGPRPDLMCTGYAIPPTWLSRVASNIG